MFNLESKLMYYVITITMQYFVLPRIDEGVFLALKKSKNQWLHTLKGITVNAMQCHSRFGPGLFPKTKITASRKS
jgi:hypothetical protein